MFRFSLFVAIAVLTVFPIANRVIAAEGDSPEESNAAAAKLAAERQDLPAWVRSGQIPFSFQLGGKSSADILAKVKPSIRDAGREGDKHKYAIVYRDDVSKLEVAVDVTTFTGFPAVDWVIRFKNTGSADTPVLENVFALDYHTVLPDDPMLYYVQGSVANGVADAKKLTGYDFQPYEKKIKPNVAQHFLSSPKDPGYSSEHWLPFFNLKWNGGGLVWGIGWSGRWKMDMVRDAGNDLHLRVGQNTLRAKLHPGESIRTPRMALLFWKGDDRMQGHNLWRQLLIAHYLPRYDGKLQMTPVAATNFLATGNGGPAMNESNCLAWINVAKKFDAEVFWLDACWFQPIGWNDWMANRFGDWDPDPKRFPHGLKVISDAAHANNMTFLVWFLEQLAREGTEVKRLVKEKHPDWTHGDTWDFSNPEARRWMTDLLIGKMHKMGVDTYRHDGGFDYVYQRDEADRQGMHENHAIEGWYAHWDAIWQAEIPIDNCAGGGRNIDLETMSRSLPYTRSDACNPPNPKEHPGLETYHQVQTAGLNLFIPLHATIIWSTDGDAYHFRSLATTGGVFGSDITAAEFNVTRAKANVAELKSLRELWLGDYYPLTDIGLDESTWCGWQFHRPDLDKGFVMMFRRPKSETSAMSVKLRGINKDANYLVKFVDTKQETTMTGKELAKLKVGISKMPGSALIVYQKQ